jgi:ABC-type molybdate transport system substrate-binding protein
MARCARHLGGARRVTAESAELPLAVFAAGSLREVLSEIAAGFQQQTGQAVSLTLGASGLLRERIEQGEPASVFASADTGHPQRLAERGGWSAPVAFARNPLCALVAEHVHTSTDALLDTLLDPAIRIGTSTPGADPSGDYAWAMFRLAEVARSGAGEQLQRKAKQLTGDARLPAAPPGQGTYAWVMGSGQADVFLTYRTNAVIAQRELPSLRMVALPPALQVRAVYGLGVRDPAPGGARAFADWLLSPTGRATFARHGFDAV